MVELEAEASGCSAGESEDCESSLFFQIVFGWLPSGLG